MIPLHKIVGSVSSGFVLCLSLSPITDAASAACVDPKTGPSSIVCGEEKRDGSHTIKGEVLAIQDNTYVVQQFYGKEVWLISDAASQVTGRIVPGDHIEAKVREVDNQKRVLSIRQIQ